MYINKIDELLDNIIDDFSKKIVNNKEFSKIISESNFVKYQLEINEILQNYVKNINTSNLKDIVNNDNNILKIYSIIKRYLAYYFFLTIGYNLPKKNEVFINNIIEFSKNQSTFNYKIDNFFNSENNAMLIEFYNILRNTVVLLDLEPSKLQIVASKDEFKQTIEFLNKLGQEYVVNSFKLENINGDKNLQAHNIIKTLIFQELYLKKEKKEVYDILLSVEKESGEFTFIEIIQPNSFYIDYSAVENLLDENESAKGYASDIFNLINTFEEKQEDKFSSDDKFNILINNKILVPVVDDFLLYHKDSEKYETYTGPIDPKKKKEDTKIRYIVNKIDSISNFYSDSVKKNPTNKKNIEKLFYIPLSDRKATLINDYEEIKIINKITNQGAGAIENNQYYNDLVNYREYPYQNFKEFQDYGFTFQVNKTTTLMRYTSFESNKKNNYIESRVSNKNSYINIVGVIVTNKKNPTECIKLKNIKDVRNISKNKNNGYLQTLNYLKKNLDKNTKNNKAVFWKFDESVDYAKSSSYQQTKTNNQENIKNTVAQLYDELIYFVYSSILEKIESKQSISIYDGLQVIKHFENKFFPVTNNNTIKNLLEKSIYLDNSIKVIKSYDKKEDMIGSLFENAIKLPVYKPDKKTNNRLIIEGDYILEEEPEEEKTEADKVGAICQHFLSWNSIMSIRKNSPNEYADLLYNFINQYVRENNEGDYVCKSCSTQLNIKKYITDGYYDKSTNQFTTFTMPLNVFLEDVPEYEKYKSSIRNVDKLVERLSSVCSISYYIGSNSSSKSRRKPVVKNIIDILIKHNKIINKYYKKRHENIDKLYGISKNFTNLFVFDLDNSIFTFSSKDKDFYKPIKLNNILVYTMFSLVIELSDSQIIFMNSDKTCNFTAFDKYGHTFFDGMKIIINDSGDVKPIKSFPILCYVIFYMSCLITKYKLWSFENKDNTLSKNKLIPLISKSIINTFVDVTNSILEVNRKKDKEFLYTLLCNRFFLQLNSNFKNIGLLKKLRKDNQNKMSAVIHSKKFITTKLNPILLPEEYKDHKLGSQQFLSDTFSKIFPKQDKQQKEKLINFSNKTNCLDGNFHEWVTKDSTLQCNKCSKKIDSIKESSSDNNTIKENILLEDLKKLSNKYCITGDNHKFIFNAEKRKNVCIKCNFEMDSVLSQKDLMTLQKNLKNKYNSILLKNTNKINLKKSIEFKEIKDIHEIKKEVENGGLNKLINKFIDIIQTNIGQIATIGNKKISLKKDTYIIDHTPKGGSLDKPIIITDTSKIIFKKDHTFFKKDVIYYTNLTGSKTDVFYDAISYVLLGYKEVNKNYVILQNTNKYLIIQDSIYNRISNIGIKNRYIPIDNSIKDMKENYPGIPDDIIINNVTSNILRQRLDVLKKTVTDFQRYMYRLIFNYEDTVVENNDEEEVSRDDFMKKYYKKLTKIKVKDSNGENKIFSNWNKINGKLFNIIDKNVNINLNINDKTIPSDEIKRIDISGNIMLYYIIQELIKLISYNTSKFITANLVYFIIDVLNNIYEFYNEDIIYRNTDVRRFTYLLLTDKFIYDTQEQFSVAHPEGFYGEYTDIDDGVNEEQQEQLYNDNEEFASIDVDNMVDEFVSEDDDTMVLDPDNFNPND